MDMRSVVATVLFGIHVQNHAQKRRYSSHKSSFLSFNYATLLYASCGCCHPPLADLSVSRAADPGSTCTREYGKDQARHRGGFARPSTEHPNYSKKPLQIARAGFGIFGRAWTLLSHTHRDRNRINKATLQQRLSRRSSPDQYQRICGRCDRRRHRTPVSHSLPSLSKETSCGHEADERLARSLVSKDTPCQIA